MNKYKITMRSGKDYTQESVSDLHSYVRNIMSHHEYMLTDREIIIMTAQIESIEAVND